MKIVGTILGKLKKLKNQLSKVALLCKLLRLHSGTKCRVELSVNSRLWDLLTDLGVPKCETENHWV